LHQIRGFAVTTAGLVLSTIMATAVVCAPGFGALLDHVRPKALMIGSALISGAGYGGLAFVDRPWQAFVCSIGAGIGFGAGTSAGPTLSMSFLAPEQRSASFALSRVASNLGIGVGALTAGLIVGSGYDLHSFQLLYVIDAASFAAGIVVLLVGVPNAPVVHEDDGTDTAAGYRAVARDRIFVWLLAANVVLVVVGYSFFGNLIAPFAKAETAIGPRALGALFLVNTAFIVIVQVPAVRVTERIRRGPALAAM